MEKNRKKTIKVYDNDYDGSFTLYNPGDIINKKEYKFDILAEYLIFIPGQWTIGVIGDKGENQIVFLATLEIL